jgi:hypothetical protein
MHRLRDCNSLRRRTTSDVFMLYNYILPFVKRYPSVRVGWSVERQSQMRWLWLYIGRKTASTHKLCIHWHWSSSPTGMVLVHHNVGTFMAVYGCMHDERFLSSVSSMIHRMSCMHWVLFLRPSSPSSQRRGSSSSQCG